MLDIVSFVYVFLKDDLTCSMQRVLWLITFLYNEILLYTLRKEAFILFWQHPLILNIIAICLTCDDDNVEWCRLLDHDHNWFTSECFKTCFTYICSLKFILFAFNAFYINLFCSRMRHFFHIFLQFWSECFSI